MITRSRGLAILAVAMGVCAYEARAQAAGAQIPQTVPPRAPSQAPGQPVESCIAGRIFGITQLQCTYCGMASPRDSTRVVYSFGDEPLVVETDGPTNRIRPGDRVVAVNGNPITTRAGADHFAYPPVGTATITVRRNNVNINIDQLVSTTRYCPSGAFTSRLAYTDSLGIQRVGAGPISVGRGAGGGGRGGAAGGRGGARQGGGAIMRADSGTTTQLDSTLVRMRSMATARGVLIPRGSEPVNRTVQIPGLGLAFNCQPTVCTFTRSRDGATQYWRFDGFPTVASTLPGSAAARAGLRDGDLLVSVNGISPMVEEGALLLHRAGRETTLQLEVRRGDKVEKITVKP